MTSRKTTRPVQFARSDLAHMTPAEIEDARLAGSLDDLLEITRHWPPKSGQWTVEDLNAMVRDGRHDEIDAARAAGQLAQLLNPNT